MCRSRHSGGNRAGLKATELNPKVRRFQLIFAKGDDVRRGWRISPRKIT